MTVTTIDVDLANARAEVSTPETQLGVLFVHGIGQQLQGETLVQWADAIACWLSRWLSQGKEVEPSGFGDAHVSVSLTELMPGDGEPAQARIAVGKPAQRSWLFAESWWAETFRAPKATVVLLWMLTILPYMLLDQFRVPLRRSRYMRGAGLTRLAPFLFRQLLFGALFVASLPLAGIGLVFILLLLVPLLIPIESLRERAKTLALKLANTLGDSFILSSSPVQFDAMVQRVARDLDSLSKKAERVVVVAHSQGAALAYEALAHYTVPNNLQRFVTVGQGIDKLGRVRELRRKPRYFRYVGAWIGVACFYLFAVCLARFAVLLSAGTWRTWELALYSTLWPLGAAGMFFVLHRFNKILNDVKRDRPSKLKTPDGGVVKWLNYYASADPVSNGPLFSEKQRRKRRRWMSETEVWNHASLITDHTAYLRGQDDFLALLTVTLIETTTEPEETIQTWNDAIEKRLWSRWWRVWWLAAMRVLAILGAIAGMVSIKLQDNLHDVGNLLSFVRGGVHYAALPLRNALGLSESVVADATLAGVVLIAAVVAGGYLVLTTVWRLWDAHEVALFFRREDTASLGGAPFGILFTLLGVVSTISVFVARYGDYPETWHLLVHRWLWSLISLPVFAIAITLVLRFAAKKLELRLRAWYPVPPSLPLVS